MTTETTTVGAPGDDVSVTVAPPDKPYTVHVTLFAASKTPDQMQLKELSIRLAFATSDELLKCAESDLRDAIFEAVRGCQSAGVTVPADLEAAADDADGAQWAPVESTRAEEARHD